MSKTLSGLSCILLLLSGLCVYYGYQPLPEAASTLVRYAAITLSILYPRILVCSSHPPSGMWT